MKIVFAGTTSHAALVLKHLISSMHQIVAVVTREDAPVGRKGILTPSPVAEVSTSLNIPTIKANRVTPNITEQLSSFEPDLGIVIAYGALLKRPALEVPRHGWLNLHFSLLPAHRGAAPVQHSILNGDVDTGVSIFKLDEGMDTGPVLKTVETQIQPDENAGELLERLTSLGISAIDECIAQIDAGIAKYADQEGTPSFAGKLNREDARIDWNLPAHRIELLVRAMNPEPMAWTQLDGASFRVLNARRSQLRASELSIGDQSSVICSNDKVYVACGADTTLQLINVQPAGKNPMSAVDWFRGKKGDVIFNG
ncbi:MAG: methionyl-tRNA formyltransferase [Micrococcales bacterium]